MSLLSRSRPGLVAFLCTAALFLTFSGGSGFLFDLDNFTLQL